MKEAADLMAALRRLIELEDEASDEYATAGMILSGGPDIQFGTCMYAAGHSHDRTASHLRAKLAALDAKYGPAVVPKP